MALETRAGLEAGVIGGGHRFAARRLDAQRSTAGWVQEQMGGLSYLQYIRQLVPRIDADWPSVQVSRLCARLRMPAVCQEAFSIPVRAAQWGAYRAACAA